MRPLVVALALALAAAAAPVPRGLRPPPHTGDWTVTFDNGVVETCGIDKEGKAAVAEPLRASGGKAERQAGGVVVLTFDDDRTERWTPDGNGYTVEHWCPTAAYPAGVPVKGVARPASKR